MIYLISILTLFVSLTSCVGKDTKERNTSSLSNVVSHINNPGKSFEEMGPSEREAMIELLHREGRMDSVREGNGAEVIAVALCDPRSAPGEYYNLHVFINGKIYRNWLTSPGLEGYDYENGFDMRTDLSDSPEGSRGNNVRSTSRSWVVKPGRTYSGVTMPFVVWIGTQKGFAVHGTTEIRKLGRPASKGCLRLSMKNAQEFYNTVIEAGVKNSSVYFAGYCDPEVGTNPKQAMETFRRQLKALPSNVSHLYSNILEK